MATFSMELEGLPEFRAKLKNFPIDGEKRMNAIARRTSKRLENQMRSRGFKSSGPASIKVGQGAQYGHTYQAVKGHGGAINWGMYVRVGISKSVPSFYKVIFHELGTKERFVKGKKTGKLGSRGELRARHMIETEGRIIISSAQFFVAEVEKELEAACRD